MTIEGVLLTGGASRRMGADKANLVVHGERLAERIANMLAKSCGRVVVLGRSPLAGFEFLPDRGEFAGPLAALGGYQPRSEFVFLASCDLPLFDVRIIGLCMHYLEGFDAVLPESGGKAQPLCALYRATAWEQLNAAIDDGKQSLMAWLDRLNYRTINPEQVGESGIDPRAIRGANSPEELSELLSGK